LKKVRANARITAPKWNLTAFEIRQGLKGIFHLLRFLFWGNSG